MNSIIKRYFLISLSGWALAIPKSASAVEEITNPSETLRIAVDQGMAITYEKSTDGRTIAQRTQPVMEKYFDFDMLTRRAAGPHWAQFNPEQKRRTQALLTELAVRSFCSHFDPVVRSQVTFLAPVQMGADRRDFPTLVTYYGKDYNVSYRAQEVSGSWHFYDVILEGVSLVANYRAQMDALFIKGGAEATIHALEQTLANSDPGK